MDHNGGFIHLTAQFVFVVHLLQCTIQLSNQLNKNSIVSFQFCLFLFAKELILQFFQCFEKYMSFLREKPGDICRIYVELIQSINYFLVMFAMMCILKFVVQVAKK